MSDLYQDMLDDLNTKIETLRLDNATLRQSLQSHAEESAKLIQQRDELLAALKDAVILIDDWGGYASEYFQEKYDLPGDISRLNAVITRITTPTTTTTE